MRSSPPHENESFEHLVRPHLETLYRLAYRLTGQVADAEDLLQDVLIRLYQRRDELSSIAELGPWASRVLYNLFVDRRRQYQRRRLRLVGAVGPGDGDGHDVLGNVAAPEPGPAAAAEQASNITQLSRALAVLSMEHRTVLLMHDSEGYKLEEIHRITGIPVGTLKSRLHRARERVRTRLAEVEPFPTARRVKG